MLYIIVFLTSLLFIAFFAGVETGVISIDPIKVYYWKGHQSRKMKALSQLIEKKEKLISLVLIGNNLCLIIASAVVTSYLINVFHLKEQGSILATLITTPLLLVFGEIIPKASFLHNPTGKILFLLPLITFFRILFKPFIWATDLFTRLILTSLLPDSLKSSDHLSREDFKILLDQMQTDNDTEKKERLYISRILRFHKTQAKEAMIPLIDVTAIEQSDTIRHAITLMTQTGLSRLPVYSDSIDSIIGIIHVKDLLCQIRLDQSDGNLPVDLIKSVAYVPETKKISEILSEFQKYHNHTSVVIDEYGASVGLISIEDVLEEIFGEIYDEYDQQSDELMYPLGKNVFILSGRLDIDILNDRLSLQIPKQNYETVAGFLLSLAGRIPEQDEMFHYKNLSFTILASDRMKIDRVRLKLT